MMLPTMVLWVREPEFWSPLLAMLMAYSLVVVVGHTSVPLLVRKLSKAAEIPPWALELPAPRSRLIRVDVVEMGPEPTSAHVAPIIVNPHIVVPLRTNCSFPDNWAWVVATCGSPVGSERRKNSPVPPFGKLDRLMPMPPPGPAPKSGAPSRTLCELAVGQFKSV